MAVVEALPNSVTVLFDNNPFVAHLVTEMSDGSLPSDSFSRDLSILGIILTLEALKNINQSEDNGLAEKQVMSVSGAEIYGVELDCNFGLVPILTAGQGLMHEAAKLIPNRSIYPIGIKRDEQTLKPNVYMNGLNGCPPPRIFIYEPMLATGGSAIAAIELIERWYLEYNVQAEKISLLSCLAAPEGLDEIAYQYPYVEIIVAAMGSGLNEKGYIVGDYEIGDCGDRYRNVYFSSF
jgi:uracil phosphoribosyltransferase